MRSRDEFDFLNSDLWIKYTQDRYVPLEDIKHRLDKFGIDRGEWPDLKQKIVYFRKMGAIPFFLGSVGIKFWYFPSDSINKKIHTVESLGNSLYDKIETHGTFKDDFFRNAAIEEAICSAIYEGANSTRSKAKALIASQKRPENKDERMLINNYLAMKWIKDNSKFSVTKELILTLHELVSKNTLEGDDANFCGKFRNDAVYVGDHTKNVHEGIVHSKIEEALDEVIDKTMNHPRFIHGLIKGILLYYFVSYVHPFFDGNGRTARTLFYFKAMKSDLKFVELLSVSANLKDSGKRYERSFELVKEHDFDMTFFIDFCLDSLIKALSVVEKKVKYLVDIAMLMDSAKLSRNQVTLLQKLALNKYREVSIEDYAESINKSREVARKELKELLRQKLLREEKRGKKYVYCVEVNLLRECINELTESN